MQEFKIRRAAVLGAGVMGSKIAAHLANVGIPSYLLDIAPAELTEEEKRKLARQVCTELIIHTKLEEELFYPACRENM